MDKYLVHDFQERLLEHIENNLNKSNCTLIFDQLLKIEKENVCLDLVESFIKLNASAAFHSDSFLQIDQQSLIRLLNFDYLNVSEFDILIACLRWAHAKLKEANKKATLTNVQKELNGVKCLINFTDLTVDELSRVKQSDLRNILSFSEMGSLFFYLNDKTIKPNLEYQANRRATRPFAVEDKGVYLGSFRESFEKRKLSSSRKILISSLFTFISSDYEQARLTITIEGEKSPIKMNIQKEACESSWVFHFRPYFEVDPQKKYLLKVVSGFKSSMLASKGVFEYNQTGTDYQVKIYLSALNDYYDNSYHFFRKILFYDCS